MRCWLRSEGRSGLALLRDGEIAGYGVIRRCREGYKIGPLFADDGAGAEALFRGLAARAAGAPVYLDPPFNNAAGIALVEGHGLVPSFETARMYRGPAPDLPIGRTFGITTFELGRAPADQSGRSSPLPVRSLPRSRNSRPTLTLASPSYSTMSAVA